MSVRRIVYVVYCIQYSALYTAYIRICADINAGICTLYVVQLRNPEFKSAYYGCLGEVIYIYMCVCVYDVCVYVWCTTYNVCMRLCVCIRVFHLHSFLFLCTNVCVHMCSHLCTQGPIYVLSVT